MSELERQIAAFLDGETDRLTPDGSPPIPAAEAELLARHVREADWFSPGSRQRILIRAYDAIATDETEIARYPGRVLLESADPSAMTKLRPLIRREVEDILAFVPGLTPGRLSKWAFDRLFGPDAMTEEDRRTVLPITAETIRDTLEATALRAVDQDVSISGPSTVGELAGQMSLDTLVSQATAAGAAVAKASRVLDAIAPDLGKTFLLAYYEGLSVDEVASLVGLTATEVQQQLTNANGFVRGQTVVFGNST